MELKDYKKKNHIKYKAKNPYGSAKDKALTPEERKEYIMNLNRDKVRIIFILGAYAGLRVGEIVQCRFSWLQWIKLNDREVLAINIPSEARDIRNKHRIWRPKSQTLRQTNIFDTALGNELYFFYKHNESLGISDRQIRNICYKYFSVSPHALRATAQNYLLYELRFSPEVISVLLGHKDVKTTMKHYTSLNTPQVHSYLYNSIIMEKNNLK